MRPYKPVAMDLTAAPPLQLDEVATCPMCDDVTGHVLGRFGRRLVFRCPPCRVRFYRQPVPEATEPGLTYAEMARARRG